MNLSMLDDRYDVVVAGARVAGASTAMLLARAGLRVLAVDPLRKGTDTLSTHALMRGGVLQLHRWGLLDRVRAAGTPLVPSTTFHYGTDGDPDKQSVTVPIKPRDGVDGLYAPRRTVLDPILVEAALDAGAHVAHGLVVTELLRDDDGRVRGVELTTPDLRTRRVRAGLVVGADGLRSRVARLVGARTLHRTEDATASIYAHVPGVTANGYHWHYALGCGIGTIPTNDDHVCVFASVSPQRFAAERARGIDALFREVLTDVSQELAERVFTPAAAPRLRAFAGAPGVLRRAVGPGWALVGDAGYFKDPLTAHGITDALRDAELLARAATSGDAWAFEEYQQVRDALARPLMDVTGRIASLDWTLPEVQALHVELSRTMSAEVDVIRSWDAAAVAA